MWRVIMMVGMVLGLSGVAQADPAVSLVVTPTEPVVNDPSGAVSVVKRVVDTLDPQVEELYDLHEGEWRHGISAALWKFTSRDIYLGSLRGGYAFGDTDEDDHSTLYGSVKVDLAGLAGRYAPETIKDFFRGNLVGTATNLLGKYGAVSVFSGYDFKSSDALIGIGLGGRISF